MQIYQNYLTCSEVEDDITEKDGVRENIEDDPGQGEIIIEEGDGHGENDEVGDEEEEHADVPVESEGGHGMDDPGSLGQHLGLGSASLLHKTFLRSEQLGGESVVLLPGPEDVLQLVLHPALLHLAVDRGADHDKS